MPVSNDFSTNQHSPKARNIVPFATRHPDFVFADGNVAILTQMHYFLVHQGVLSRHSNPLRVALKSSKSNTVALEGRPVLELEDTTTDMHYLLLALYDGVSYLRYDTRDFDQVSAVLRLSTKYQINHLREEMIRGMSSVWPSTLAQWDIREANATNSAGLYEPRLSYPHPIQVINLAQFTSASGLLPSAFYDLSRCSPSETTAGLSSSSFSERQRLNNHDLMNLLKGKEHASRFLSTFIVNNLEGRVSSLDCLYREETDPAKKRNCQAAFEATTFETLRDLNGVVCHRTSDPLLAIMDTDLMHNKDDLSARSISGYRPCEYCRLEYGSVVDVAREELWQKLPSWFGVDLQCWS